MELLADRDPEEARMPCQMRYVALQCDQLCSGYVPLFVWREQISIIVLRGWVRVGHPRGRVNEGWAMSRSRSERSSAPAAIASPVSVRSGRMFRLRLPDSG